MLIGNFVASKPFQTTATRELQRSDCMILGLFAASMLRTGPRRTCEAIRVMEIRMLCRDSYAASTFGMEILTEKLNISVCKEDPPASLRAVQPLLPPIKTLKTENIHDWTFDEAAFITGCIASSCTLAEFSGVFWSIGKQCLACAGLACLLTVLCNCCYSNISPRRARKQRQLSFSDAL